MAEIPQLTPTTTLGSADETILRQGTTDKRISLELANTLSWAKREGYTYLGEYQTGLTYSSTEQFYLFNSKPYFVEDNVSLPYTTTSLSPEDDRNLYTKNETYFLSKTNGANLLSNHNFLIQSPDSIIPPSSTPTDYVAGTQIFSGVFVGTDITGLTYINGRISFLSGDFYFTVPNTGGLEYVTQFTASVSDFDGKPRTRGASFALVGNEYRVTVGIDALEDESAALTPLGSVKFEQGSVATRHEIFNAATQSLRYRVGQKAEIHSAQIPDWLLKADGSIVSRTVDDVLWSHAATSGLVIAQATKDASPEQYAMYYGDGDGSTTFSLPNWYLGHFARGNPAGVALGDTLSDAIRNISGSFDATTDGSASGVLGGGSGVFEDDGTTANIPSTGNVGGGTRSPRMTFNASRQVPTASENRPKSGHINICIERGKIPT